VAPWSPKRQSLPETPSTTFCVAVAAWMVVISPHLTTFVLERIDQTLPVQRIARGAGMSPRALSRFCREHLDESHAELVRRLRLDEARRLLAETPLSLKDITARTGLGDASTLWRVFTRHLGITPAAYRQRFASATPKAASDRSRSVTIKKTSLGWLLSEASTTHPRRQAASRL
jgi:AraC-like DNA-binding protein